MEFNSIPVQFQSSNYLFFIKNDNSIAADETGNDTNFEEYKK